MSWDEATAVWWAGEVGSDPAYSRDVDPILFELIGDRDGAWLDVGCGDGRLLAETGAIGVDASPSLARGAARSGRAVVGLMERLPFAADAFDGAYAVLVVEHASDIASVFDEIRRIVRHGGELVVVMNHPVFTAPGSSPLLDPTDGELSWRWGEYLSEGSSVEHGGTDGIEFHHRPIGVLLEAAAASGFVLERVIERALTPVDDPLLAAQTEVPRLLGVRWRNDTPSQENIR